MVDSNPTEDAVTSSRAIAAPFARTAAVVDRTARIANAAKDLVTARFSFCGLSPYAPDVVFVNEFSLKEFCNAAAQRATALVAVQVGETTPEPILRKAKFEGESLGNSVSQCF